MARTALLIGANRGTGLNLARALAAKNWNVVASVRPQTKQANDPSVQEVRPPSFGDGPLDMLINIAGLGPQPGRWHEHSAGDLQEKFTTNAVVSDLDRVSDGWNLAYRVSKVALNMVTVTLAKEFQENGDNIAVIALNPGYVPTRMTNFHGPDDMDECIAGIVKVIENASMDQTGSFLDWRGNILPW
ncbi:hypothetical protein QBC36DRAFT_352253 [Triangularia setosa]|uniref:Uncharacterized protein n=1 Tax=Triangularia setosa TaxID=2587417 RepID=A0AAN6W6S8_9PEZI|nr:hypothetical protein QBC36DRAFT_352253 [Podospora setosa]